MAEKWKPPKPDSVQINCEVWAKKKKKSCLVPTCGDPDVTGVMWRLGSDVFNMFHK